MADEIILTEEQIQKFKDWLSALGTKLRGMFTTNEANRRPKETEWLEDLRQIRGIYDPDVKIEPGNSKVYPKITRAKNASLLSRLNSMLFPSTDRNYTIEPTPEPDLAQAIVDGLGQKVVQEMTSEAQQAAQASGQQPQPLNPEEVSKRLKQRIKQYAANTGALMQSEMDDQLIETKYVDEAKSVLKSGVQYGTGIFRGPFTKTINEKIWNYIDGKFVSSMVAKKYPIFKFTRLWDFYPDMGVTDPEKLSGYFERHVMNKLELQDLAKRNDFYGDVIRAYMAEHPKGDATIKSYEQDLHDIDSQEKRKSEGVKTVGENYEVLEFWGLLEDENGNTFEAEAWLLGNQVIKQGPNDIIDGKRPHRFFYYEKDETSIFGQGLARIIRHSALSVGGAARAALDNAACVAGPQMEVNVSLLMSTQDLDGFYARKMWYREGYGVDSQYPALRAVQFDSHLTELLALKDHFMNFADVESCLPAWVTSEAPKNSNETVGAASIKVGNVLISLEDIVKNFDALTTVTMRAIYLWNMEFNPRNDIKGDCLVKAQGSSNLITKEVRMQSLNLLSTTLTPEEWCYVPRGEFLREKWKAHGMPASMLRSDDEAAPYLAVLNDPEMKKLAMQVQLAEIDYKKAMTLKATAQAKDKNAEAGIKKPAADAAVRVQDANVLEKHAKVAEVIHGAAQPEKTGGQGE